jgi:hypothetical protein
MDAGAGGKLWARRTKSTHITLDHGHALPAPCACREVTVQFDHGQGAAALQQRQRESAKAGADLHQTLPGSRVDRVDDRVHDAGIAQEVLSETLARDVLHRQIRRVAKAPNKKIVARPPRG